MNILIILMSAGILVSSPIYQPLYVNTPEKLTQWLQKDFTYQKDESASDIFKKPVQTIKDKGGDCEDFARLTHYLLKNWGHKAEIIVIYRPNGNHAVTVFKDRRGMWRIFDNQYLLPISHRNFVKIISVKYPKWTSLIVVDQKTNIKTIIHRK